MDLTSTNLITSFTTQQTQRTTSILPRFYFIKKRRMSLFGNIVVGSIIVLFVSSVHAQTSPSNDQITPEALTLPQLAQCARTKNPALNIAQAELEKMKSALMSAQANRLPELAVESLFAPLPARRLLKYCVSNDEMSNEGLSRVIPCPNQNIQDDARLTDTDGMGIYTRTTATLTQPLYTFGKISSGIDAAEAGVRAYQALTKVATYQVDELAFQTYYGLILADRAQKIFRKGKKQLKKLRDKISKELKLESGKYTTNDLRKLTIKESEILTIVEEVSAQQRLALRGVRLSCELGATQKIKPDLSQLKPLKVKLASEEDYLKRALTHRPEVNAAQAQLEARRAQRDLVISRFFPDLALIATFNFARGTSAEDNPDPFANDPFNVFGYGAYLGLRWRLDFAQIPAKLKAADAAIARAEADLSALTLQLSLEISERYQEVLKTQRVLDVRHEAMVSGKQLMTSAMMNVNAGLVDSEEILSSITSYFTTSLSYDRSIYEYNLALMRLWAGVGDDPLKLLSESL